MPKRYSAHGYAGCVSLHTNRQTGSEVGVYHAEQAGYDPAGGPWVVVCHTHNRIINATTLEQTVRMRSHPAEWCEFCSGLRSLDELPGNGP